MKNVKICLTCQVITPMFLGNAFQGIELRAEPFKGLLRYWWRVAVGKYVKDEKELLEKEGEIFGRGGENAKRSEIVVRVEGSPLIEEEGIMFDVQKVFHPEVKQKGRKKGREIDPFLYLGYGPIVWDKIKRKEMCVRDFIKPEEKFTLILKISEKIMKNNGLINTLKEALLYVRAFGAVGARARNGWGSFQVIKIEPKESEFLNYSIKESNFPFWEDCFEKDYPNGLGRDDKGLLLWKSKEEFPSWKEAMRFLAEVYIYVRTGHPQRERRWEKIKPLTPLSPDGINYVDERHLLGFPLTNHPAIKAGWGKIKKDGKYEYKKRLASPLRFLVRKKEEKFSVFILHLPFRLSEELNKKAKFSKAQQIKIWKKVHSRLDQIMRRAKLNECL